MNAEMQVILDQLEEENLGIRKKAIEALKKWEYQWNWKMRVCFWKKQPK